MYILFIFLILLVLSYVILQSFRKKDVLAFRRSRRATPYKEDEEIPSTVDPHALKTIPIDDFLETFIEGECIPEDLLLELQLKRLAGEEEAVVSAEAIAKIEKQHEAFVNKQVKKLGYIALRELATKSEEKGDADAAIKIYKEMIASGYPACYPYDCLMSIYRDRGDYEQLAVIVERALEVLGPKSPLLREKYLLRSEWVSELKLKQQSEAEQKVQGE